MMRGCTFSLDLPSKDGIDLLLRGSIIVVIIHQHMFLLLVVNMGGANSTIMRHWSWIITSEIYYIMCRLALGHIHTTTLRWLGSAWPRSLAAKLMESLFCLQWCVLLCTFFFHFVCTLKANLE